jgi:hypothetical protein
MCYHGHGVGRESDRRSESQGESVHGKAFSDRFLGAWITIVRSSSRYIIARSNNQTTTLIQDIAKARLHSSTALAALNLLLSKRSLPFQRNLSSTPASLEASQPTRLLQPCSRPPKSTTQIHKHPTDILADDMDSKMDVDPPKETQPHGLSPSTDPGSIPTLDGWIENLMSCKQLAENDVQRLCDRV